MLRHILDLPEIASRNFTATDSDFLDPYEQRLVRDLLPHFPEVEAQFVPAGERERKVVLFCPYPAPAEDAVSVLKASVSGPIPAHRDILGSLLGLGIERAKIGDIVPNDASYVVVKREIANFLLVHWREIGNQRIQVEEVPLETLPIEEKKWRASSTVVQSPRLDAVVRAITKLSRDEVKSRIAKGLVKVDFQPIRKTHWEIHGGELLSVRGFGRAKIGEEFRQTKKGKVRFEYGTLQES